MRSTKNFWSISGSPSCAVADCHYPRNLIGRQLRAALGSDRRALRLLLSRGRTAFGSAQAAKRNDLLVYLASANLRRELPFQRLPEDLQEDIRTFFGSYRRGLEEGFSMIRSAADSATVVLASDDAAEGWQDERSLYVAAATIGRSNHLAHLCRLRRAAVWRCDQSGPCKDSQTVRQDYIPFIS